MSRGLVGTLIGVAVVAAIVVAAMGQLRVSCEVCVHYAGGQVCERARAASEQDATMQATTAACARLTNGVTNSIRCSNTPPVSVTCSE